MSATYVYVISAPDETLYVGHTSDLFQRLAQHATEPWAGRVTHVTAEVFANKAEALTTERNYIADLEPEFNGQGNPRYRTWAQEFGYLEESA